MHMAHCQMARFYGVPSGGYIGLTNAHLNDAQLGYETGIGTTGAVLAGSDMLNMGGLLDSLMAFDFAKAVIDNEIGLMLKRFVGFPRVNQDCLALDVIKQVGPGGSYMEMPHTMGHMRDTAFLTRIANREMRTTWEDAGRPDIHSRALKQMEAILGCDNPHTFAHEIDTQIRERFTGLVAGDARRPTI